MARSVRILVRLFVLAAGAVLVASGTAQAALSPAKGSGFEAGGMIWLYFAAIVLGTLGLAFMPSNRKES